VSYKVFLVEDEVTTREGIRDNVDWHSVGFELCGEASDGEVALPQIEIIQPDVLITDIKMPFMDGLQLCRIIRQHWAWMKIIIISGYNDFQYAQSAIKLGVSEYVLKPVSVQDLQTILARMAFILDQEKVERAHLKQLSRQVQDTLQLQREKFLLRLLTGGESAVSAIEQGQELGLNLMAPCYQVYVLSVHLSASSRPLPYETAQQVENIINGVIGGNPWVLLTRVGPGQFVFLFKAESMEQIEQESAFLAELVREEIEKSTDCSVALGAGSPQRRLGDLYHSFAQAWMLAESGPAAPPAEEIKKADPSQLFQFLQHGNIEELDAFFDAVYRPLIEPPTPSGLMLHYLLIDATLATAKFLSELGGNVGQLSDSILTTGESISPATPDQFKNRLQKLAETAFAFRDSLAKTDRSSIIQAARAYIAAHYTDPNLSLAEVAAHVHFSPNHFSVVFSEETGSTFKDYLTQLRIEQAKKLLRMSHCKCSEVACQVGYNDPHYFSLIFRKKTGLTPQQYRTKT